ncbi:IS4 family transposase, partial [Dehalobacter restrictus]
AVESRNTQDDRTIGELFYYYSDEMEDLKLSQALVLLIDTLRRVLSNFPVISQELANMIMDTFLSTIPRSFKERLLFAT